MSQRLPDDQVSGEDEQWTRKVLAEAVDDLAPTHRLDAIRAQAQRPSGPRASAKLMLLAAAVAVAVVILTVTTLTIRRDGDRAPVADQSTPPTATASDPVTPEPTPTPPPEESGPLPIYWVGDGPLGPRLYRELQPATPGTNPLLDAANRLVSGAPYDPDYRSLWPQGRFESVGFDGIGADGTISVALPDDSWTTPAPEMTPDQARLAIQQLVYTLQGVVQDRAKVVFTLGGRPTPIFGIDSTAGITNGSPLDVLNLMSITTPAEGETVTGTLTASGAANSFEASVRWQLRQGETIVKEGFATAHGWAGNRLFPWETTIDVSELPPGQYTFFAFTDDPTGGETGGPSTDSKTITIG